MTAHDVTMFVAFTVGVLINDIVVIALWRRSHR